MILNIRVSSCLLSQPTVITFNQMQPVDRDGIKNEVLPMRKVDI